MDDDLELERLRRQRMEQMLAAKHRMEHQQSAQVSVENKVQGVLRTLLQPDAFAYLEQIRGRNPELYQQIRGEILPPEIMGQLDVLISYMMQGQLRSGVIDLVSIQYWERKMLGVESTITVKRRHHDAQSLSNFLNEQD
jgi:DNA-binding TFAR19-related protein (PDSD5 family)